MVKALLLGRLNTGLNNVQCLIATAVERSYGMSYSFNRILNGFPLRMHRAEKKTDFTAIKVSKKPVDGQSLLMLAPFVST